MYCLTQEKIKDSKVIVLLVLRIAASLSLFECVGSCGRLMWQCKITCPVYQILDKSILQLNYGWRGYSGLGICVAQRFGFAPFVLATYSPRKYSILLTIAIDHLVNAYFSSSSSSFLPLFFLHHVSRVRHLMSPKGLGFVPAFMYPVGVMIHVFPVFKAGHRRCSRYSQAT